MARTKGSNLKCVQGPKAQSPRIPRCQKNAPTVSRQHRYRQGARARMEIHKWRYCEPEKLLILRLPFECLCYAPKPPFPFLLILYLLISYFLLVFYLILFFLVSLFFFSFTYFPLHEIYRLNVQISVL